MYNSEIYAIIHCIELFNPFKKYFLRNKIIIPDALSIIMIVSCAHVNFLVDFVSEGFVTETARIIFLTGVPNEMAFQIGRLVEHFGAVVDGTVISLDQVACIIIQYLLHGIPVVWHITHSHVYLEIHNPHRRLLLTQGLLCSLLYLVACIRQADCFVISTEVILKTADFLLTHWYS
jgi:hypothetical protein